MNGFQSDVYTIIKHFTGHQNVLTVNVTMIDFVGDLETALLLSQLIYWSDKGTRSDGFIYKTDKEWYDEIRITRHSLVKAKKKLGSMGILETKVMKANGNPTVHYRINKQEFVEQFMSFCRNQQNEMTDSTDATDDNDESITETTAQTTDQETSQNGGVKDHNASANADGRLFLPTGYFLKDGDSDVEQILSHYYQRYEKYIGTRHPRMKANQLVRIYETLERGMVEHGLMVHDMRRMIDEWFADRHVETDYNLNHFATEGVLEIRKHRVM